MEFVHDRAHWLRRLSPDQWIQTALAELGRAEAAYAARDRRGGLACARRGAGMGLNGLLLVDPHEHWGRSYVAHLRGLADDMTAPGRVREACLMLTSESSSGPGSLVQLRSRKEDDEVLEAARDVVAHAYAIVIRKGAM